MKIAYFGIPGSFTYSAAKELFSTADFVSTTTFSDIFDQLKQDKVDCGVIPIENSLAGSIYENYDLLETSNMMIVDETYLKVEHCLLGKQQNIAEIKKVISHPKALEQCSHFFSDHPKITHDAFSDTASAAKHVAQSHDKHVAAIASKDAAKVYKLHVIAEHLENDPHNYTRFLVIAKDKTVKRTQELNKCSVIVTLLHEPGSLGKVFSVLARENCNLTKIESRPMHDKPFEYVFYLDFIFDSKLHDLDKILKMLADNSSSCRVLGVYKDART